MSASASEAMLAAIDAIRLRCDVGLTGIVAFLQVCENEGLSVKELAYLCGMSEATVSRAVHALRSPYHRRDGIAHEGLLQVYEHPEDRRRIMVCLTEDGQALRDSLARLTVLPALAEG